VNDIIACNAGINQGQTRGKDTRPGAIIWEELAIIGLTRQGRVNRSFDLL